MIKKQFDTMFSFETYFDDENGNYYRTNILGEQGEHTNEEPFMAQFPHHLDLGIMGSCEHGLSGLCASAGIGCYQSGGVLSKHNMPLSLFTRIVKECEDKVFQFALGGRGDPDCHENFEDILDLSRQHGIVPNYTTSGYLMNGEKAKISAKYCGAVAVSWYRNEYTHKAIRLLCDEGVSVNVHYVLNRETIDEAIEICKNGSIAEGVKGIVFLLHKPVGQGSEQLLFNADDERLKILFSLFGKVSNIKIGFDSCCVPLMLRYAKDIPVECFDACEGARFSGYIDSEGFFSPCSFDVSGRFAKSLENSCIKDIWFGEEFSSYRKILRESCPHCNLKQYCLGGCPISPQITLCNQKER